jgi:hypothetical protein
MQHGPSVEGPWCSDRAASAPLSFSDPRGGSRYHGAKAAVRGGCGSRGSAFRIHAIARAARPESGLSSSSQASMSIARTRPLKCPHCRRCERLEDRCCFRIAGVSQNRRTTDLVHLHAGVCQAVGRRLVTPRSGTATRRRPDPSRDWRCDPDETRARGSMTTAGSPEVGRSSGRRTGN